MTKQLTQLCGVECIFGAKQKIIRHSQKLLHSFLVLLLILCSQFILLDYYIKSSNFNSQAKTRLRNFCIRSALQGTLSKRDQALTFKPDPYFLQVIFKPIVIQFSYTIYIASRKQVAIKTNVCFVYLTYLSTSLMISFQHKKVSLSFFYQTHCTDFHQSKKVCNPQKSVVHRAQNRDQVLGVKIIECEFQLLWLYYATQTSGLN